VPVIPRASSEVDLESIGIQTLYDAWLPEAGGESTDET
jgi:hypothetical protein